MRVQFAIAALVGACIGCMFMYCLIRRDVSGIELEPRDRALQAMEQHLAGIAVKVQELQATIESQPIATRSESPVPIQGLEVELDSQAEVQRLLQVIVEARAQIEAIRDDSQALHQAVDESASTIRQRLNRAGPPRWQELERFTKGCDQEQWHALAMKEIVLMSRAEVLDRFGTPTEIWSDTWTWAIPGEERRPGGLSSFRVEFKDGLVSELRARHND